MKKMNEKLLAGVLAVSALAGTMVTSVAHADVGASAGVANMYYWRGQDLGYGDPAVWGDVKISGDTGLYGGLWASSGDIVNGTEYDLYFGYGTKVGDFGIDLSYWSYNYPSLLVGEGIAPGDFAEVVLGLSYGPVAFTYYDNVAIVEDYLPGVNFGSEDYSYFSLGYTHEAWGFKYGEHSDADGSPYDGYAHFDISYAVNSTISLTMGNVIDDVDDAWNDEIKFVISASLPIAE